ncbi:hypothetical protein MYAM1_000171 [Malassezia yamatoensis]|uniref:C2 domain-containing protein n=1 Tax=Malassezia yamatoensis TaxID=253288 RepID=A0AAJ5YPM3_9BASI|nr:hypothetical protein MYAM1_000171 [Malassezia yamatoensis]
MARRHRGTLVCVVLKAKNLPNKRSIGKQDPYAELSIGSDTQCTKPDRRGGQHPMWDEQLHFEIYDSMHQLLASDHPSMQGHSLGIACYAHDKDSVLIGDATLSLDEVLRKGEHDQWISLSKNDRYAGEIYLELTFYSLQLPKYGNLVSGHPVHQAQSNRYVSNSSQASPHVLSPTSSQSLSRSRVTSNEVPQSLKIGSSSNIQPYTPPYVPNALQHTSASLSMPNPHDPHAPQRAWTINAPEWASNSAGSPTTTERPPSNINGSSNAQGLISRFGHPHRDLMHLPTSPEQNFVRSASTPRLPYGTQSQSHGRQGDSSISSPRTMNRSESVPWMHTRSNSAQWLQSLNANDSISSTSSSALPHQWNATGDFSVSYSTDRNWSTHAEVHNIEEAAAALAALNTSQVSAHEAIYGSNASPGSSRPLPLPRSVSSNHKRPLPIPQSSSNTGHADSSSMDSLLSPPAFPISPRGESLSRSPQQAPSTPPRSSTPPVSRATLSPTRTSPPPSIRRNSPHRIPGYHHGSSQLNDEAPPAYTPEASLPSLASMSVVASSMTAPVSPLGMTTTPPPLPPRRSSTIQNNIT